MSAQQRGATCILRTWIRPCVGVDPGWVSIVRTKCTQIFRTTPIRHSQRRGNAASVLAFVSRFCCVEMKVCKLLLCQLTKWGSKGCYLHVIVRSQSVTRMSLDRSMLNDYSVGTNVGWSTTIGGGSELWITIPILIWGFGNLRGGGVIWPPHHRYL